MDRSVEEQQEEIEELEARCERLREVLRGMAGRAEHAVQESAEGKVV